MENANNWPQNHGYKLTPKSHRNHHEITSIIKSSQTAVVNKLAPEASNLLDVFCLNISSGEITQDSL